MIHCSNPHARYVAHRQVIDDAIRRVLDSGWYILGREVQAFESAFAAYIGTSHAVGVGNGTDGIALALRACGIGPGDEVITVSHTAVATVAAIEMAGATPVMVDIDPATYTIDPSAAAVALTSRTRAIIPVHLYGHPADMTAILELAKAHQLRVIEDASQAHGATHCNQRVGGIGHIGVFSLYPTKNLGGLGDAGIVVTDDQTLADRLRELRQYGWSSQRISNTPGVNTRLDELQAAILSALLPHLDAENARRAEIAAEYDRQFKDMEFVTPAVREGCTHVYHQYVIRCPNRDALLAHLRAGDIAAQIHYPVPVHLQSAYQTRLVGPRRLPATETIAGEILSLPMYPELTDEQVRRVIASVRDFRP